MIGNIDAARIPSIRCFRLESVPARRAKDGCLLPLPGGTNKCIVTPRTCDSRPRLGRVHSRAFYLIENGATNGKSPITSTTKCFLVCG